MRISNYIPSICQGDEALYEGHLVLKVPHAIERANFMKRLNIIVPAGLEDVDAKLPENAIDMLPEMFKIAEETIQECHLKSLDGEEITTEDLFYDPDLQGVLTEVANKAISGFKPSKN